MLATLRTATVFGLDSCPVVVEVDVSFGFPGFNLVGLPDTSVRESRDRVRTAIRNSGYPFPPHRITVNLAPADVRKAGTAFDLPIALGILAASGVIEPRELGNWVVLGGLSLDGGIQGIRGVLPIAAAARREGLTGLLLPASNVGEAALVGGLRLAPVRSLAEAGRTLASPLAASFDAEGPVGAAEAPGGETERGDDLAEVEGQAAARRGLEVAAAGGHNLLFVGPPGSGKTMMARRLPGILPPLTLDEALESLAIHSVAGVSGAGSGLSLRPPFRAPHHTASHVALVGGGSDPRPGEVSLAHHGVLFLDEVAEFERRSLEALRQPLEEGRITITRAARSARFPARFTLLAAMNPCPCGFAGDARRACRCTPQQVERYRGRLSGPLLDRIDLIVEAPSLPVSRVFGRLAGASPGSESSAAVRARVVAARERQRGRFEGRAVRRNAAMTPNDLARFCRLDPAGLRLLEQAGDRLGLTGRGCTRVLRVARTIADLAACDAVQVDHIAEALQYRMVPPTGG